jgi:hypothetical protein
MKKLLAIFTAIGLTITTSVFATDTTPSTVLNSFQNAFKGSREVAWSTVKDLYRVDFTFEDQKVSAFFNSDGNLIASSRNISLLQLPISLETGLKSDFPDYEVVSLFEVDNENGTTYYATVKNSKREFTLESASSGEWNKFNKQQVL